ncbi:MAG TPA: hypothetical protein VGL11_13765, partial [Candidatus Binatia bacterium]
MEEGSFRQEEVAMPGRYWEALRGKAPLEPERKLMLAVLEEAIHTYRQNILTSRRLLREVETWLFDNQADDPFSFQAICDALDLSAECVRRGILRAPPIPTKKQRPHLSLEEKKR